MLFPVPPKELNAGEMRLGAKIKYLRQHHKLTLIELVRESGVSKSTWHRAEQGEDITISTLQAIADALGVELIIDFKEKGNEGDLSSNPARSGVPGFHQQDQVRPDQGPGGARPPAL